MQTPSLTSAVRRELLAHPDVTEGTHRFGGIVFHLGRYELGHLHGETVADLPLPPDLRDELVASGRISPGHVAADSAWLSRGVNGPEDIAEVVELFRISLEHATTRAALSSDEEDRAAESDAGQPRRPWRDALRRRSRGR